MDISKIQHIIKDADYFSGAIHIVQDDKPLIHVAKGYAKREDEIDNKSNTAFGIASGTKGFTALAILTLIDVGKLLLDDDVFELLHYDFPNVKGKITVRHLLSHTSGIYDYFDEDVVEDFGQLFEKVPIHKILGPSDMLPLLIEGESYFKPGEKFKYCNSGFVILGMLIETVSKMTYSDYLERYVIKPLGLTHTGCYKTNQLPANCACGYLQDEKGDWKSNIFGIPMTCTADGGLFTTADDIYKMWQGFLHGDFISTALKNEALKAQATRGENRYYGLGFYIDHDENGVLKSYFLVGGDPGVEFYSYYFVKTNTVLTIIANKNAVGLELLKAISEHI